MAKKSRGSVLIPVIACLVAMFGIGIVYLWGVFQKPVTVHYGWEPESVRMISSVMIFMFLFGTMIGGFMLAKRTPRFVTIFGGILFFAGLVLSSMVRPEYPWMMYITYGVIAGMGSGFAYASSLNCIIKWFPHRRGFGSGLSVCAFGLSAVVVAPLAEWLLKLPAFGDNAVPLSFRTLAIVFTAIIVLAGIFIKTPDEEYLNSLNLPASQTKQRQYKPLEVIKSGPFWCLVATVFFLPSVFFILNPIVKTLAEFRGVSEAQATLTLSLTGVVQAISRLICGVISDRIGRARTVFIITCISVAAALLMTFVSGWAYTIVVWLVFFVYAGPSSIYPGMATDVYGIKNSGANYGMALMFLGLSSPVFTMISNNVSPGGAATGNYTVSFIIAACACIAPLIALPLFDILKKRILAADNGEAAASEAIQ